MAILVMYIRMHAEKTYGDDVNRLSVDSVNCPRQNKVFFCPVKKKKTYKKSRGLVGPSTIHPYQTSLAASCLMIIGSNWKAKPPLVCMVLMRGNVILHELEICNKKLRICVKLLT